MLAVGKNKFGVIHKLMILTVAGWIGKDQQKLIEYLIEEIRVLLRHLEKELKGRRLVYSRTERIRLGRIGHELGRKMLSDVCTVFTPETILKWYQKLASKKYDSSSWQKSRKPGRPKVPEEIEELVIDVATENPSYGYLRIVGILKNLGYEIDKITVKNILTRNGYDPSSGRK